MQGAQLKCRRHILIHLSLPDVEGAHMDASDMQGAHMRLPEVQEVHVNNKKCRGVSESV